MKKVIALILALLMVVTLSGCDSADYKKAVSLYESGSYEEAIALFSALGDYEDSHTLLMQCRLDYAKELYETGNYPDARDLFLNAEQTEEVALYLRLSAWGMVRDYLDREGTIDVKDTQYDVEDSTQIESVCQIGKQGKSVVVAIQSTEVISFPILSSSQTTITNTTVSFDGKDMQPQLEAKADVTFKGPRSSSTFHNVGTCIWDIVSYQADTPIEWSEYIHIDEDGGMDDTRKAPAFDERVAMQQTIITSCMQNLLDDMDSGLTMADLGFMNY